MGNQRFSITQAAAVSDPRISDPQHRTLAALGLYGDKNGWCWPSLKELAKTLNKSRQAVSKDIQHLSACGYVQIYPRYDAGARINNKYRLLFDTPLSTSEVDTPSTSEVDTLSTPEVEGRTPQLTPQLTPAPDKPARKRTAKQERHALLCEKFSTLTAIPVPKPTTGREKREAAVRWWTPINRLMELCNGNAEEVMDGAWQRARGKYTVSAPASIEKEWIALAAEKARNGDERQIHYVGE